MTVHNFDDCDCDCHDTGARMHIVPCCFTCPVCGLAVRFGAYTGHIAIHQREEEATDHADPHQ